MVNWAKTRYRHFVLYISGLTHLSQRTTCQSGEGSRFQGSSLSSLFSFPSFNYLTLDLNFNKNSLLSFLLWHSSQVGVKQH